MGGLLFFMTNDIGSWHQADVFLRVKNLSLSIAFGVIIYIFTCLVTGLKTHDLVRGAK